MSDNLAVFCAVMGYLFVVGILVAMIFMTDDYLAVSAGIALLVLIGTTLGLIAAY